MTTNSRGLTPDQSHLDERAMSLAYIREMNEATDKRMRRKDKAYTEADAAEYRAIWEKHHGPLKFKDDEAKK